MTVQSMIRLFFNEPQDPPKTNPVMPTSNIVQKKEEKLVKDFEEVSPENNKKVFSRENPQKPKDVQLSEHEKKAENEMEFDDYGEFDDDEF